MKVDQHLPENLKTLRAAADLEISKNELIGILVRIWAWGIDNIGVSGEFDRKTFPLIAEAAGWRGNADSLLNVLLECGGDGSGFIEQNGDVLKIHDWTDYAGELLRKRAADRERKRKKCASVGNPAEFQRNSSGTPGVRVKSKSKIKTTTSFPHFENAAHTQNGENAPVEGEGQPQNGNRSAEGETYRSKRGRLLKGTALERFNKFWKVFNYKKDRAAAADSWLDLKPDEETFTRIIEAAEREARARPALVANGRTPKYAQGWLTARRFEDEHADADAGGEGESFDDAVRRLCPGRPLTALEEELYFEPPPEGEEGGCDA